MSIKEKNRSESYVREEEEEEDSPPFLKINTGYSGTYMWYTFLQKYASAKEWWLVSESFVKLLIENQVATL